MKKKFIFCLLFILFSSNNAYAYLDPGSVTIFFQVIAAILSSFLLFLNSINNFIKYLLNKKLFSSIIIITLSIFPIWVFKSSFSINMIIFYLLLTYFIPLFLILILIKNINSYYTSEKLTPIQNFIITLIIFYGFDLNIGLWTLLNYFPFLYGENLYIFSIIFILMSLGAIFYLIKKSYFKYIFILLFFIFSSNLILQNKNLNKLESIISFDNYSDDITIDRYKTRKNPVLFIVLDEMNGIGGLDTKIENYEKAKNSYLDLAKSFDFTIYPNSYTTIAGTLGSIPRMLNFDSSKNELNYNNYIEDHNDYFFWKK